MSAGKSGIDHRLGFITWMQIIGCVLVILGHSYPLVQAIPEWAQTLRGFIYQFHMPLFVWCSGYLLVAAKQTQKYAFFDYAKHRAVRILMPYVAFSLIGIVPKILFSKLLNDTLSLDFVEILRAFCVPRENIWGHFWFLPMIYILGLIGYGFVEFVQKRGGYLWIITVPAAMLGYFAPMLTGWFALNDIVHYALYLFLGIACAQYPLSAWKARRIWAGICAFLAGMFLFVVLPNGKGSTLLVSLCVLFTIWMLSLVLTEKLPVNNNAIFAQTYSIFILSWPCQLVVEVVLERLLKLPFALVFPAMLVTGLTAPPAMIAIVTWLEAKTGSKIISKMIGR